MNTILKILLCLLLTAPSAGVSFSSKVHDFGTVKTSAGPLKCEFTVTNTGDEPLLIQMVVASCNCTTVSWTRAQIQPGGEGKVEAVYRNDEGPHSFDKTLTVYTSAAQKPVVLHMRGNVVR